MSDKGGNPNWTKGVSGNPKGRKPSHFGQYLREHPSTPLVLEKILGAALDDDDPRQKDAWKIVANKIAPDLKAQEITAEVATHIGVIALPPKKPPTPLPPINGGGLETGPKKLVAPVEVSQKKGVDKEVHEHPLGVGFAHKDTKKGPPPSEMGPPNGVNGTKDKI